MQQRSSLRYCRLGIPRRNHNSQGPGAGFGRVRGRTSPVYDRKHHSDKGENNPTPSTTNAIVRQPRDPSGRFRQCSLQPTRPLVERSEQDAMPQVALHGTLQQSGTLLQAPLIDRLDVEAPVAPDLEARYPSPLEQAIDRRSVDTEIIRKLVDRHHFCGDRHPSCDLFSQAILHLFSQNQSVIE
jgi:hypothetical protein